MPSSRIYSNHEITVYWDPRLCEHSTICIRNLPKVFNPARTPWVDMQAEPTEKIMATIDKCPSGALSYTRK